MRALYNTMLFLSMVALLKQTERFLTDAEDVLDGYYEQRRAELHRKVRRTLRRAGKT